MTDLTTDNLMAMHGEALASSGREAVHKQVVRSLRDIDYAIRAHFPEEHGRLDTLEVSEAQKEAAMRVLRKYGDSRMIALTRDVASAFQENAQEVGDHEALKRRLSERLQAKLPEIQQLSEEMFPGAQVTLNAEQMPALGKWHPKVEIDLGGDSAATARRLSSLDSVHEGVRTHAQSLFESLQGGLGEKMPKAPARMLSLFGDSSSSSASSKGGSDSKKDEAFMTCMAKAVPSPPKVCKCIQDNMSDVIKMVMGFMKGKP